MRQRRSPSVTRIGRLPPIENTAYSAFRSTTWALSCEDVRINVGDQSAVLPLTGWSVEQTSQSQLTIHTVHPITAWNFDLSHNMLKISSTATNGVLTAEAPATSNRIPARVLDPQGFPVDWIGTDEAPLEYGGTETRNQSFLPLKNPEVMYFCAGTGFGIGVSQLVRPQTGCCNSILRPDDITPRGSGSKPDGCTYARSREHLHPPCSRLLHQDSRRAFLRTV